MPDNLPNKRRIIMVSKEELHKALNLLSSNWSKQNNISDQKSNFIYYTETVDECLSKAREMGIGENYVLHRWYNYHTSKYCEYLFVKHGAKKESNEYHHDIDIYINGIPYDVKLTVYPAKLVKEHISLDLNTRDGKNELIKWMYKNQSQQGRKHLKNRFFIVCNGKSTEEKLAEKSDFDTIERKIENYFKYLKTNEPNKLTIKDDGNEYTVYSEIISI